MPFFGLYSGYTSGDSCVTVILEIWTLVVIFYLPKSSRSNEWMVFGITVQALFELCSLDIGKGSLYYFLNSLVSLSKTASRLHDISPTH